MNIIDQFKETAAADFNPLLSRAKNEGKKIMGYFCAYIPEEIIHAAGFIPYRMRTVGTRGTLKGDVYYSSLNCTFVRHCFDKALNNDFDFLDGIIFMNGCDHTRRMYDNWRHVDLDPAFRFMFIAPHMINSSAENRLEAEIQKLISAMEDHYKFSFSMEKLKASIELYNRRRELLSQIDRLRKNDPLPIRGSEFFTIIQAVTALPVEESITLLEKALDFLKNRDVSRPSEVRVFIAAGCIEEISHLELIESSGGAIVGDNICLGSRYFDIQVDEAEAPLRALALRYLNHVSCPRMMNDFRRRIDFIKEKIRERKIEAIIAEKLKFCDLWGGELFIYRREFKEARIPLLPLELELYSGSTGQVKTRIQAFFEQVRNRHEISDELIRTAGSNYRFSED